MGQFLRISVKCNNYLMYMWLYTLDVHHENVKFLKIPDTIIEQAH